MHTNNTININTFWVRSENKQRTKYIVNLRYIFFMKLASMEFIMAAGSQLGWFGADTNYNTIIFNTIASLKIQKHIILNMN